MKSKKNYSIVFVIALLVKGINLIATSKIQGVEPCQDSLSNWYNNDLTLRNHSYLELFNSDSLVIFSDSVNSINCNSITDSSCKIYSLNYSNINKPIPIVKFFDTVSIN